MESTEKKSSHSDTRVVQMGTAYSTVPVSDGESTTPSVSGASGTTSGSVVKSIQTGREQRSKKQRVIVRRDDDEDAFR